jgi:hypothetical protein
MLFEHVSDDRRERAIKLLEDSLFKLHTRPLDDVPPTMPGFTSGFQTALPHYRVHINTKILKV